jgi:hypothetical protein
MRARLLFSDLVFGVLKMVVVAQAHDYFDLTAPQWLGFQGDQRQSPGYWWARLGTQPRIAGDVSQRPNQ